ncbi:MAG: carbamoyltransferase C-terminal domain-containing protein [Alphaproteobacteria bacterium]
MNILGIHDGHNCGATLVCDGRVVASVCEERLTRRKNEAGYPARAIEEVLRLGGVAAGELDEVVYASEFMHARNYLENLEPWYVVGLADQRSEAERPGDYRRVVFETRRRERIAAATDQLGIPAGKVSFVEHHLAHLAAAYFTAPNVRSGKPVLGLTCDGSGDGIAATVSVCRDGRFERIAVTDRHASLGKIYSRVTLLMGMKPWEHEYKIMGLAPYAEPERAERAADKLRAVLRLRQDGLAFEQASELSMNYVYEYLENSFRRVRFDVVAAATQKFTEEMMVKWAQACVRKTGIGDLVCGGGVFMNVKANMAIAALPEVRSMYVMPSASDESLSIGAALLRAHERKPEAAADLGTLTHLYLGGAFDRAAEERALADRLDGVPVEITETNDMELAVAELLAKGEIVARCSGAMEWGARALGNRSILASAHDFRTVDSINTMIKKRDFWMPFAPSIRAESAGRYFDDPKDLKPWFMTFAFPTRAEGRTELAAASHPRDGTIRPQVVGADANPGYHRLISHFESLTGRGGVLNTSFNLHGEPIVHSPSDAVHVFVRSGLRHLALGNFLVSKTGAAHG